MKNFCVNLLFAFVWVTTMPFVSAQTKPVEEMSVQELRQRVAELETQTGKIKALKDENKRLRRQLRKIRMQLYDSKTPQVKNANTETNLPKKEIPKETPQEDSNDKSETIWDWLTK